MQTQILLIEDDLTLAKSFQRVINTKGCQVDLSCRGDEGLFAQALKLADGNQAKAARWLGIGRVRMREKLLELGLHPSSQPQAAKA